VAASLSVDIEEVSLETRPSFLPLLDQSFAGIYRWHARRTLRSAPWVRGATRGTVPVGVAMLALLGGSTGYVWYVAVAPSERAAGIGGLLLDDALRVVRAAGARETLACVRSDNAPSIRLFRSRDFVETGFRELVRSRGLVSAALLWLRMVAAPGEKVFLRALRD
jgi:ribosomal protein S18 acetylase RimI-like enzyme